MSWSNVILDIDGFELSPEEKDILEQQFNEIHHAYNILSNEESRQQYDQGGWEYIDSRFS